MAQTFPYLGSKISLISKSEIRYEGILYTIDPDQSIIALSQVVSFGTEDRHTDIPVPGRSDVYDYIIFRGSDIKNVDVLEAPKLHDDPAIVKVQHSTPIVSSIQPNYNRQLGPIGGSIGGLNLGYGYGHLSQPSISTTTFNLPSSQPSELTGEPIATRSATIGATTEPIGTRNPQLGPIGSSAWSSVPGAPGPIAPPAKREINIGGSRSSTPSRKSPVSDAGVQVSSPSILQDKKQLPVQHRNQNANQQFSQNNYRGQPNRRNYQNNYYNNQGHRQQNYNQRPNYNQGYYPNQYYNRGQRGPRRQTRGRPPFRRTEVFDKEFDFELANEEFEELRTQLSKTKISDDKKEDSGHETATTGDESEESDPTVYYDRQKSFFDSISCESIERSKGRSQRPDWRHERKLNVQTFGVATARRGFYPRGRGGYYQGGYRRGYSNQGYNNQGYNNQGYNNQGYNNQGYNNQGYNQGYNNQGYYRGGNQYYRGRGGNQNRNVNIEEQGAPVATSSYASAVKESTA